MAAGDCLTVGLREEEPARGGLFEDRHRQRLGAALMTVFNLVQFGGDDVSRVLGGCSYLLADVVGVLRSVFLRLRTALRGARADVVGDGLHGVLGVAPSLLDGAFDLIGYAGIGEMFVADGFADRLFGFPFDLVDLARYRILIHGLTPCMEAIFVEWVGPAVSVIGEAPGAWARCESLC